MIQLITRCAVAVLKSREEHWVTIRQKDLLMSGDTFKRTLASLVHFYLQDDLNDWAL